MAISELSRQGMLPRDQQEKHQHPSNRSSLLVQADGMVTQSRNIAGTAGTSMHRNRSNDEGDILRFRESERLLHWAIAIPFVVCWITALILILVYNPDPARPYRIVFAAVHRISGVCLVLLPVLSMLTKRSDFKVHLYNIKNAWLWSLDDLKWLFLMGVAAVNKKIVLPQQGKFNAAEKVNFILVMVAWPVFTVTGIMMWMQNTPWFPWLVHVTVAFLATPTMLGHIYMATINPDTRKGITGMLSGYVDRHWAKHHYARWYQEQFIRSATRNSALDESQKRPVSHPGVTRSEAREHPQQHTTSVSHPRNSFR